MYYYLEEYDEALTFALGAGNAFQPDRSTPGDEEYIETLICGAISLEPQASTEILLLQPRPLTDTSKLGWKSSQALWQKSTLVYRIS